MEKELGERLAMALEGIEAELGRLANATEKQANAQTAALEEQRAFIERQEENRRRLEAQMGAIRPAGPAIFRG
jgi:anti-sigma factor ChrR (cupin superfamily)